MANYEIEIYRLDVESSSIERVDKLITFQNLNYSNVLNGIGACQFTLDVFDPKATKANLTRFRNQVVIRREGEVVWFGPITSVSASYGDVAGDITVQCATYLHHLKTRLTDDGQLFIDTDQADIAWDLINTVQSRTNGELFISQGLSPASNTRNRTYYLKSVAEAIIQLANVLDGFDFDFAATLDSGGLFNGVDFDIYYPRKGSDRTDLEKLKISINIDSLNINTKEDILNQGIAHGSGTGTGVVTSTLSFGSSQKAYTRRELFLSEKDILEAATLSLLLQSKLNQTSVEQYTVDVSINPEVKPAFTEYEVGDTLYFDIEVYNNLGIKADYLTFKGAGRVIEIAISVDDVGAEIITPRFEIVG